MEDQSTPASYRVTLFQIEDGRLRVLPAQGGEACIFPGVSEMRKVRERGFIPSGSSSRGIAAWFQMASRAAPWNSPLSGSVRQTRREAIRRHSASLRARCISQGLPAQTC